MVNAIICSKCFEMYEPGRAACWKCHASATAPATHRDYMRLFGLRPSWNRLELKTAFLIMARKHHPDANPGNTKSGAYFKFINTGYEALCAVADEKSRIEATGRQDARFKTEMDLGADELNEKVRQLIRISEAAKAAQAQPRRSLLSKLSLLLKPSK